MKFPIYPKLYLGTFTVAIMALFFYMQSLPERLSDTELEFIQLHTKCKKGHWPQLEQMGDAKLVSLCRHAHVKDKNADDEDEEATIYVAEPVVQQMRVTFNGRYKYDLLTDLLRCTVLKFNVVQSNFYLAEGDSADSVFKLSSMRNSDKNGRAWIDTKIVGLDEVSMNTHPISY